MTNFIKNFLKDEEGATAIEYGLIAGLIAVAIIGVFATFGEGLTDVFSKISAKLKELGTEVGGAAVKKDS